MLDQRDRENRGRVHGASPLGMSGRTPVFQWVSLGRARNCAAPPRRGNSAKTSPKGLKNSARTAGDTTPDRLDPRPDNGGDGCRAGRPYPSGHPALRRPSIMWAWSSGRTPGRRLRISDSTCAGAIAIAFSSASFASAVRPSWPSAAASTR